MADLVLVDDLCEDDQIKSVVDEAAKHLQHRLYQLCSLPDLPLLVE